MACLMKMHDLKAKSSNTFKATTNSRHDLTVAPNLLAQNFKAEHPNEKWVSDHHSYCWTEESWLYLEPSVMNLYSHKIVRWFFISTHDKKTGHWSSSSSPQGLILHSDRGSQYFTHAYQELIQSLGIIYLQSLQAKK